MQNFVNRVWINWLSFESIGIYDGLIEQLDDDDEENDVSP